MIHSDHLQVSWTRHQIRLLVVGKANAIALVIRVDGGMEILGKVVVEARRRRNVAQHIEGLSGVRREKLVSRMSSGAGIE